MASVQDRDLVAQDLEQQKGLNSRMERDVDRFKNKEALMAKVTPYWKRLCRNLVLGMQQLCMTAASMLLYPTGPFWAWVLDKVIGHLVTLSVASYASCQGSVVSCVIQASATAELSAKSSKLKRN